MFVIMNQNVFKIKWCSLEMRQKKCCIFCPCSDQVVKVAPAFDHFFCSIFASGFRHTKSINFSVTLDGLFYKNTKFQIQVQLMPGDAIRLSNVRLTLL